ncbi:MAG: alpha,alpha-trehalose-phosphate synthase [Hyphomicrobiaceae bacterium]|nr:MAG: alpha,alpha-trehalose-phosphate synthase [Hyphomicrobiaceae bacterium]
MSRVVLVSNRVMDLRKAAQAGGVAVALADIVRTRSALWFGWSGETAPQETADAVSREGRIVTVPLTASDYEGYYLGYANSVLWPVFHNRLDLAQFEAGFFERYMAVNSRLAALLQPMLRPDDIVWVHDYHMIPFAMELRKRGVANPIGFYLHIPFPPWQTFMAIPEHQQLAHALSAYDLIGLQTKADVGNFVTYLENGVYGRIVPDGRIRLFDRLVSVASFPVGIDVEQFANAKRDAGLVQARQSVSRIIGIDRLDYTKGLPQKFKAFGKLLEKYPQYRRQVVLTQIAPPTREDVEAYASIRRQLESLAGSVNGRFGELDWVPIHYIRRSTPRRRLADIYRSSRICMVTPLRDGMNLVAKEYVAAQDPADPGVLILSQFAGAAEEMSEALIVNPYSIDGTADVIRVALEMDLTERQARHAALMAAVRKHDATAWAESFLAHLARGRSGEDPGSRPPRTIRRALQKLQQPTRAQTRMKALGQNRVDGRIMSR